MDHVIIVMAVLVFVALIFDFMNAFMMQPIQSL